LKILSAEEKVSMFKKNDIDNIPELLEIEPAKGCNLRCIMCHVPHEKGRPEYIDLDNLRKSTEGINDCHVIIGSEYEPTIHPEFEELLRLAIDRNWKIDFLTNGVRLDKVDPKLLADVNFHVFNVSFDGATENTFSKIRIGANYTKVLDNIMSALEIVSKNGTYTAVNATLLDSNLHEAPDMVKMWNEMNFDLIRMFVMQARSPNSDVIKESLYSKRSELAIMLNKVSQLVIDEQLRIGVRNGYYGSTKFLLPENLNLKISTIYSNNPDYRHVPGVRQDMQLGDWPGMNWPCKSPFVYCRIRWDGSVDLCNNRDFVVGNINEKSLVDIWNDKKTNKMRNKIKRSPSICKSCDYFRFCIGSRSQDIFEKESHFAGGLLQHSNIVNL
tara:strand:+ start:90516 stop:91670 length:1155 start_codon:yes stop_codon:yes gene_type:complete